MDEGIGEVSIRVSKCLKEKKEFDGIKTYQDLNAYIDKLRNKKKANFILIDENCEAYNIIHTVVDF